MRKTFIVRLSEEEQAGLRTLVGSGVAPARTLTRARILLKANQGEGGAGWTDAAIAGALDLAPSTVFRVRRHYAQEGLENSASPHPLTQKAPDRVYERKLDGVQEAKLVVLACSPPPDGE